MEKVSILKRTVAWMLVFAVYLAPLAANAQNQALGSDASEATSATTDAERDARAASNGVWFFAGCLGGVLGLLVTYAIEPSPPASKFIGRSAVYTAAYTDTYRQKVKSSRMSYAVAGCLVGAVAYVVYIVAVISAANSTSDY